jgi:hypothetical protein
MIFKGNLIYTALVPLIRETIRQQQSPDGMLARKSMDSVTWLREHATIRLQAPREMGHTLSIQKFEKDAPEAQATIILTKNANGEIRFNKKKTIADALSNKRGTKLSCLAIDNAFLLSQSYLEVLYNELLPWLTPQNPFILLLIG